MESNCDSCMHSHTGMTRIIVDNRVADEYLDWDCDMLDKMSDEDVELANANQCKYYEYTDEPDIQEVY